MDTTRLMNRKRIIVAAVLTLVIFFWGRSELFSYQTTPRWQPLQRVPGYLDDTFPPVMIADQNKTVHAFVHQWVGDDFLQMAIVYQQWTDAGGWTNPVDILLPPIGEAQVYDAYLDQTGMMHLIFRAGNAEESNIYYANTNIVDAGRATAWSKPELVAEGAVFPGSGAIIGDGKGNLAIIYNGNIGGNGVYSVYSSDNGQSWSEAEPIYLTFATDLIPFSLRMTQGEDGVVHAVWNVVNDRGVDISLYYAKAILDNNQWNTPVLLDTRIEKPDYFGPSFPDIAFNGQDVVIMYNSGNPDDNGQVDEGRPVQRVLYSDDGGETWSDPGSPFPRHLGRSGSHALDVDSAGVVHAVFIQRIEPADVERYAPIGGLWHSKYENGRWSEPELIELGEFSGHDVQAVISQGNNLLVAMREDPGVAAKGVWYTSTYLNVPELPVSLPPTPAPMPTITPTPPLLVTVSTPAPALNTSAVMRQDGIPPGASNNPAKPILIGLLPVIIIILGTFFIFQLYRH